MTHDRPKIHVDWQRDHEPEDLEHEAYAHIARRWDAER